MKKSERSYNLSDAIMLQHAETVAETISQDMPSFKGFDSTLADSYSDDIKAGVDAVKAIKTDKVVIDEMTERTQRVNNAMAACNTAFRTIKFFVLKRYPENTAVQNQFGFNDIGKVRQNQAGMVLFMSDFIKVTDAHKEKLIEEGCNAALLDKLPELLSDLQTSKTAQEVFKKERGLITQERIEKLNEVYELLVPISEMAQIIFADDEARLKRYLLPSPKSSTNSADDLIV